MCGICGVCSTELSLEEKHNVVTKMAHAMMHRGPDGLSVYVDDAIAIANVRLAIVDISYNKYILWNEAKTIGISFNGEIYNHLDLRQMLSDRHTFESLTDTEVIIHLYEERGINAIPLLKGDFAFVLWDVANRTGHLVRDPVGVKPLYYAISGETIVFASEIKALLQFDSNLAELDYRSIYHYLTYRFVPNPETVFRHIKKLLPGHTLSFSPNGNKVFNKYWDFPLTLSQREGVAEETIKSGSAILETAIIDRIPKEVNYGILLSGGLDSSLITAIVAQHSHKQIRTYSVAFLGNNVEENVSEHINSRLISQTFRTLHTELPISAEMFRDSSTKAIRYLEEPLADPPAVLLSSICQVAGIDVKVLLSGEGADELLGGYFIYPELIHSPDTYTGMGRLLMDSEKLGLLSPRFRDRIGNINSAQLMEPIIRKYKNLDSLTRMLYLDSKYWLVDDLLLKADKMGMMNSIEIRVPYLDQNFIKYAFSLPSEFKMKFENGQYIRKYILRRIGEPFLPKQIIQQPKRGFPLPLGIWLKDALREWTQDLLFSLLKRQYFDDFDFQEYVSDYFEGPPSSLKDHIVWAMVALELFHQEFVN